MVTLTVHDIGLIKVRVSFTDFSSIAVTADVVIQVPALVFIKHSKHSMLLLVSFQLEKQKPLFVRDSYLLLNLTL